MIDASCDRVPIESWSPGAQCPAMVPGNWSSIYGRIIKSTRSVSHFGPILESNLTGRMTSGNPAPLTLRFHSPRFVDRRNSVNPHNDAGHRAFTARCVINLLPSVRCRVEFRWALSWSHLYLLRNID